jgi:hypothetical protein
MNACVSVAMQPNNCKRAGTYSLGTVPFLHSGSSRVCAWQANIPLNLGWDYMYYSNCCQAALAVLQAAGYL